MTDFWQGTVLALVAAALFVGGWYAGLDGEAAIGVFGLAGYLVQSAKQRLARRVREARTEMRGGAAVLLAASLALPSYGCGVLSGQDVADGAVRCARDAAPGIVGEVAGVLMAGGEGWQDRLLRMAEREGTDAVLCSAEELLDAWHREPAPEVQQAADRCETFLRTVDVPIVRVDDYGGG